MTTLSLLLSVAIGTFFHFGASEGIHNSYLTDIEIDSVGCIWMSSEAGLSRYDGSDFTNLNSNNSAISQNRLNTLHYVRNRNTLLVGSNSGLFQVNCLTMEASQLQEVGGDVLSMEESLDGGVWIGHRDNYLFKMDSAGKIDTVRFDGLPSTALSILEMDDFLAVGHEWSGLSLIDKKTGEVHRYTHTAGDPNSLPGYRVYSICKDSFGHLWIGTERGLALFNPTADNFTVFNYDPLNPQSIVSDHIYSIIELSGGKLWICTDIGGISILDLHTIHYGNTNSIEFINIYATYDENGLSSKNVRKVLEDDFGNIWVVHHSSGLDCIVNNSSRFHRVVYTESRRSPKNKLVSSVAVDSENRVWVGFENEVARFNADGTMDRTYLLSPYLTHSNALAYSMLVKGDQLYVGLYDTGLLKLDITTGIFKRVDLGQDIDINCVVEDEDGTIWVGTKSNIYHLSGDGKDTILSRWGSGSYYSFVRDGNGNLWVAGYGLGIVVLDSSNNVVTRIRQEDGLPPIVLQLCKDSQGRIWAATENGLALFPDISNPKKMRLYNKDEGLRNTYIHGIQLDNHGNVWCSTDAGISVLNPDSNIIKNYSSNYGVPASNFIDGASAYASNGIMCFGSQAGLCYFSPDEVLEPQELSDISIKECYFFEDDSLNPSERLILMKNGEIFLNHNHKSFIVKFGVKNYSQQALIKYEYCIPELDPSWIQANGNFVTFRKLPSGKYTLLVHARLQNSDFDDIKMTQLKINVAKPFLLSWWFIALYIFIIALAVVYSLLKYKRKVAKNSLEEIERRNNLYEQELNKERLTFYTNITHELRTPLTLILSPLEEMKNDPQVPDIIKSKLDIVRNSAGHLLDLVNQLLEFRRSESRNRKLTVKRINLKNLINEIGYQFKELNTNCDVNFVVDTPDCDTVLIGDKSVLTIIINNLLGNAAKFTKRGEIRLCLEWNPRRATGKAIISVSDTGYGISPEDLPHIFDRFYQAKTSSQTSGTGIGLALSKTMAELHEASLAVESTLGKGSVFTLELNIESTYPLAIHEEGNDSLYEKEAAALKAKEAECGKNSTIKLLIVEDNDDIRNYLISSLSESFSIISAKNGVDGLNLTYKTIPDLIVSDIMMPEMNGFDMARKIKKDINTSHIPIILLTAKDDLEARKEGYDIGVDSYLTKPFSIDLLISRIENILKSRQELKERTYLESIKTITEHEGVQKTEPNDSLCALDREFIDNLVGIVNDNISNPNLDLDYIQKQIGMSHSSLYRKTKALTGYSPIELIRKVRLSYSVKMLKEKGLNVSETAIACGFNDIGHFISCFKKEYGTTPSKYKQQ